MKSIIFFILCICLFTTISAQTSGRAVQFDWFEYTGNDSVFNLNKPTDQQYQNPILAGFYPDPSICRVGNDYYLINSTFGFYPGIPIFHSTDLVHWSQIGHILDRPSQLKLDKLNIRHGLFAPSIRYYNGVFYMICTSVYGIGNFYATATNPAGPWSEPVVLRFEGIDPSFYFDDNGKAYVVNNGAPEGSPLYNGHRAIWIQEFDIASGQLTGPRKIIVNGGVDISKEPVWIEGPHIFKKDGFYFLIAAEGGTSVNHSQVVFRSKSVWGPWEPYKNNPILTQRDLDPNRPFPVTCAGHVDMVETSDGQWWSVFLACRPYEGELYNTGRETFLLPVSWKEGWPVILEQGIPIPYVAQKPKLKGKDNVAVPLTGNFTIKDEFDYLKLPDYWSLIRTPYDKWYSLQNMPGSLSLQLRPDSIESKGNPSFIGRRQQHLKFSSAVKLSLVNPQNDDKTGLIAFQNERFFVFAGVLKENNVCFVTLEKTENGEKDILAKFELPEYALNNIKIKLAGNGKYYDFYYAADNGNWIVLKTHVDCSLLSTHKAGGFTGAMIGMYAFGK